MTKYIFSSLKYFLQSNKDLENGSSEQILYYQPAGKTEAMI